MKYDGFSGPEDPDFTLLQAAVSALPSKTSMISYILLVSRQGKLFNFLLELAKELSLL